MIFQRNANGLGQMLSEAHALVYTTTQHVPEPPRFEVVRRHCTL
jgi:hypothetical protein